MTGQVWEEKLLKLTSEDSDFYKGVSFYYYVQYLLHSQLLDVSKYAAEKGVVLKGDLPIGIDHDSVDAWYTPHLFNMHKKTGAPPDDYAEMGQNWGFPTYNWDKMAQDGYSWWRQRLGWMANYFQAYRIDHILGFFRIWEMPASATGGLLGKFSPSLPLTRDELRGQGLENLIDRLCDPYIRQNVIEKYFGHDWGRVKDRYLDDVGGGVCACVRLRVREHCACVRVCVCVCVRVHTYLQLCVCVCVCVCVSVSVSVCVCVCV